MPVFSGSIVLYNNKKDVLVKAINSFLAANPNALLYLVDNSPFNTLKDVVSNDRIIYFHDKTNPGFGASHNVAIKHAMKLGAKFHFIINPDVFFEGEIVNEMIKYMNINQDVGMMMPKVLNTDGSIQYLPKLLPTIFWIIRRKLKRFDRHHDDFIRKYELRFVPEEQIYNSPILSGCFTLLNLNAMKEIGGYDDKFFMYFEDFDLSRRMHESYKTLYFPLVHVFHEYEGGANKSFKLFRIFIISAITYFNKWGWFVDKKRNNINRMTLRQF